MAQVFNFSPGPAMLPLEVMLQVQAEFTNYKSGLSPLEINHRHHYFLSLFEELNANLKKLLNIPKNYRVLWTTGGATAQFSLIPLNLLGGGFNAEPNSETIADYFSTGYWSNRAILAASKYIHINKVMDNAESNYTSIKDAQSWRLSSNPLYIYHTPNETISGLKFNIFPEINNFSYNNAPVVADMTSCILSEPLDISRYGLIFASAQKNLGPTGITIIIIREDLIQETPMLPDIFSYEKLAATNSLLNTAQTFNFYVINLVLKWLMNLGGLAEMQKLNQAKALKLYQFLDGSDFYTNDISPAFRSLMNVTFDFSADILKKIANQKEGSLHNKLIEQAEHCGLFNLAGHRTLGGFRASIYNAMPLHGVDKLIEFLKDFSKQF